MMEIGKALLETDRWFEKAREHAAQFHALAQLEQRPRPNAMRVAITHYADLTSDAIVQAIECATYALTFTVVQVVDDLRDTQAHAEQIDKAQAGTIELRLGKLRVCEAFEREFRPIRERWYKGIYDGPECDALRESIREP